MDYEKRLEMLRKCAASGDCADAESLALEYIDSAAGKPVKDEEIVGILNALKSQRCFASLSRIADRALLTGVTAPIVYTLYAQGLIDQGYLDAAIDLINTRKAGAKTERERSEFVGLLGRAYKQRFVEAGRHGYRADDDLKQAIRYYSEVYALDPAWHGANLVALVHRAERNGIVHGLDENSAQLATRVISDIGEHSDPDNFYTIASIAEVSLALKDWESVVARYRQYVMHPKVRPFHLEGSVRQLREIWGGLPGGDDPVSMILTQVEIKTLNLSFDKGGGQLTYTPDDSRRVLAAIARPADEELANTLGNLEAVHGDNAQIPIFVTRKLHERAPAVCRVVNRHKHPYVASGGSGFLVNSSELRESIPASESEDWKHPVLVTNNHVLSDDGRFPSVRLNYADAVFDELGKSFAVDKILWQSPREQLDVTIAKLRCNEAPPNITIPVNSNARPLADCSTSKSSEKIYVIGHPLGQGLAFSLADNQVVDHEFHAPGSPAVGYCRIHYGAPTQQGNSGGPVLDEHEFKAMGIHRAVASSPLRNRPDLDPYKANEAVAIHSVLSRL